MSPAKILGFMALSLAIALAVSFGLAPMIRAAENERAAPALAAVTASAVEQPAVASGRSAFIDRENDGHYWARADIGGIDVRFMVDTGASVVALTYRDAQRLGLKPENLAFDSEIRTAGGITYGARVRLPRVRIGRVEVHDVDAVILNAGLDQSLLGMTFLRELHSYEFRQGQLIIRQ